ncbi:topoisomerase 1-associated factor 1 [Microthyrium microscopicum]|uniref:Topoisomerase 1-associated factor 1 n=1 Tax=Microthyrium microscopicum TaxID=703497 RepID=A0A6A6U2S1_9PEZI|nr:topoisomerase 1-associated factor 1 [Microthyrium microscopicum]
MSIEEFFEKRETVDPEVRAYVGSLVTAVGGTSIEQHGRYVLGDDVIGCLKDLRRWIKFYDEKLGRLDVQRVLAESNFVKGDILEILADWPEDGKDNKLRSKIALLCLELLVPLTWTLEVEDHEFTAHHHKHLPYLRLAQVGYKRAILQHDSKKILRQLVRIALPAMAEPKNDRSIRDDGIIRLVLYAIRNVVMITQPADLPADVDEIEISRSKTIDAFYYQDILQLLLTVASSMGDEFTIQDVVLLEALFHLLKGIDPTRLFMKEDELIQTNTQELKELMRKEKAMHAGYARYAPTRHNRFGTMLWLTRDQERVSTISGQSAISGPAKGLQYLDKSKKWNKPKTGGRKANEDKGSFEFDMEVPVSSSARRHLRKFVEDFLDSAFNPLFTHLRRSIERELDRVLEMHKMQYFYLVSWFLQAESSRRQHMKQSAAAKGKQKAGQQPEEEGFGIIAGVMNKETFVLLNRFMQTSYDSKDWHYVNSGMKCFTQILLTVQQMEESNNEEDQEIADNIQNNLFYEEGTHTRVIDLLRNYKDQGRGYLNAVTELAHVFIRMLERYAKQNTDMQIRSRRRTRKKKQAAQDTDTTAPTNGDDASGPEDVGRIEIISRERKFDFARFSAKFMQQGCVDTFVEFTKFYRDLSVDQLKRAHRFFHRVAFKAELSTLLFRVDIVQLFQNMIKGEACIDHDLSCFKEWEELVRQLFKRMIKRVQEHPELMVEMLFSKIPSSMFYLEHGFDKEVNKSAPRPPAELEVNPKIAEGDRIGVVTEALVSATKSDLIKFVKDELSRAAEARKAWEDEQSSWAEIEALTRAAESGEQNESSADKTTSNAQTPTITVKSSNKEVETAMFKNNKFRLLMTLVGFLRMDLEDTPGATWYIPSALTSADLTNALKKIQDAESTLSTLADYPDAKAPEYYLRRKSAASTRIRSTEEGFLSSEDDASDNDGVLFPAGGPTARKSDVEPKKRTLKRKRAREVVELDDAELAARAAKRRLNEKEKSRKIKSALWVHESDDESDQERDKEFFAKEEERRQMARKNIANAVAGEGVTKKRGKKRKSDDEESDGEDVESGSERGKRRKGDAEDDPMDVDSGLSSDSDDESDAPMRRTSEDGSDGEDTPVSSQPLGPSQESAGLDKATEDVVMDGAEDSDDGSVKQAPTARKTRAGFIIDDSDSE